MNTRTETLIPANTVRATSGKYEFTNIAQSIAIVADDTPAKKRLRTKKFIKSIFTRIQTLDNTIDTKTEGIKINREILAFTDLAKKKAYDLLRYNYHDCFGLRTVMRILEGHTELPPSDEFFHPDK